MRSALSLLILLSLASELQAERLFPIGHQQAAAQGAELPLPFGLSLLYNRIEDDTDISGFRIDGIGDIERVSFKGSESTTDVINLRSDLWLFPFLNVYVVGGQLSGSSETQMSVQSRLPGRSFDLGHL